MKKISLFLMLSILGFGLMVQTAQAADLTSAPNLYDQSITGPNFNARFAIAPYAQVVPDSSYTFIGITHPSLATAHTSIGVVVEALDMTTVPNNAAGQAAVFTVSAGQTHRVFVVNQSHSTINSSNSLFTDTQTHLITTADTSQFGNIKVTGVGTHPTITTTTASRPGDYADAGNGLSRWDNVSQLSMWGVVYQTSNGAGFALEFIGDMHDSSIAGSHTDAITQGQTGHALGAVMEGGAGRGIN
jgi:hypothetical protein